MFKLTIDELAKLGDKDVKYGQSYWGKSLEDDVPIMFNSMEDLEITEETPTISITAEERVEKESKKGNLYYRLRKVKVVGAPSTTTANGTETITSQSSFQKEVLARLDTLTALITDMDAKPVKQAENALDPIIEDVPDEPLSLEDIPFGENEAKEKIKAASDMPQDFGLKDDDPRNE